MIENPIPQNPLRIFMAALFPGIEPLFELMERLSKPEVAAAISAAFEDFECRMRGEEKGFVDFIVQNGWVGLERHFTSDQLRLLTRISAEKGVDAANARVPDFFSKERLENMVQGWRNIPYFENRSQLCSDSIQAYGMGQHTLLIPALMPLQRASRLKSLEEVQTPLTRLGGLQRRRIIILVVIRNSALRRWLSLNITISGQISDRTWLPHYSIAIEFFTAEVPTMLLHAIPCARFFLSTRLRTFGFGSRGPESTMEGIGIGNPAVIPKADR